MVEASCKWWLSSFIEGEHSKTWNFHISGKISLSDCEVKWGRVAGWVKMCWQVDSVAASAVARARSSHAKGWPELVILPLSLWSNKKSNKKSNQIILQLLKSKFVHADISQTSVLVKIQKHDNTISMVFTITVISSAIDGVFLMLRPKAKTRW